MSGYIGPLPVPQGIQRKQSFTATASQTTFNTNGYTDGDFINVYLNGVRLINGTDYTATNGSDIVLTTGATPMIPGVTTYAVTTRLLAGAVAKVKVVPETE